MSVDVDFVVGVGFLQLGYVIVLWGEVGFYFSFSSSFGVIVDEVGGGDAVASALGGSDGGVTWLCYLVGIWQSSTCLWSCTISCANDGMGSKSVSFTKLFLSDRLTIMRQIFLININTDLFS